ncbi:hypothetical protein Tco_1365888 [Tanacetum coccineum]
MRIPEWMLTEEMNLTRHYQMYISVFGVDFPMTQSQPIEFTQGMHRTLRAPKIPNHAKQHHIRRQEKYPVVSFPENDIKGLASRWLSKRLRRFNLYVQYSVEYWKNIWAKQHHIRRQEKKRDNPDEVYSESKIVEVVRTLYDLGHEHKYITEIMVRRANGKFDAFSKSDYKYLYKNDIEDLYLMCKNGKVKDYRETELLGSLTVFIRSCIIWETVHDYQLGLESYQHRVNLTTPTITFPDIEMKKLLTITSKPVVGLIYVNNKKEKRVMVIKDIPKFCDATLIRVLALVEKKNMHVKHGYADPKLSDNDAEYLRFYDKYIKDRLRHPDQMRRWDMYVNGRPLGQRRDRLE